MRTDQLAIADKGYCPGSRHFAGIHDENDGPDRVVCPFCRRSIVADRETGKLARHKDRGV